jgi:outer membrane lipoprotein carrier protein
MFLRDLRINGYLNVKIVDLGRRALTLSVVLSIPVAAVAFPPRTAPQASAQGRPRTDGGTASRDASAAVARADAGVGVRDAGGPPAVVAPPGSPTVQRGLTAQQVVAGVQSFYNRTADFEADFRQFNTAAATNGTTESAGHVQIRRPGRMRWEYSQPRGNLVVSDGTTLWTYEPANRQAFLANLSQSQLPSALSFLMGTGNLGADFDARIRTTTARGYENFYMLELTPRAPNPSFARLVLFVEPQNYQVAEAAVIDAQNNRNRFQFVPGTVRVNTNPAASRFQWSPPAGTNVIRP